jgi:hypothetical protein
VKLKRFLRATRTGISDGVGFITERKARQSSQRIARVIREVCDSNLATAFLQRDRLTITFQLARIFEAHSLSLQKIVYYAGRCRFSFNMLWNQEDIKVTLSVCLITQLVTNTHERYGGIAPRILNLGSRSSSEVSFSRPGHFIPWEDPPPPGIYCLGGWLDLTSRSGHCKTQKTKTITKTRCDLQYSAVAFYARIHSWNPRIIHTILIMDCGCFCLPSKVAPPCGKRGNILDTQVFEHMYASFLPKFQTLRIKWDFITIFYVALFQIRIKCDLTALRMARLQSAHAQI